VIREFGMEFLKIVGGCIVAAVLYGVVHDQITARVYLPYFTVFHPPVFHTQSPTLQALGWGIIATWWMGAFLGFLLAMACRVGTPPKLGLGDMLRPIGLLLLVMAATAIVCGIAGFVWGSVPGEMRGMLPPASERRFLADWWAHSASYACGFIGGLFVCALALEKRKRARRGSTAGS
jgi:hypothetical protein